MKARKRLICGLLAGTMLFGSSFRIKTMASAAENLQDVTGSSNKYEFRGAWMSTAYNIDWPEAGASAEVQKNDYINKIDGLKDAGFNAVMFQVRPMGDAFYLSNYAAWSQYLTGNQGTNPGYDPLAFALDEANKRNMEFHAWFNPFRISTNPNFNINNYISSLPAASPLKQHPEWIVKYSGNKTYFSINIGIPEARQYIIDTIMEVVKNYNIDGVHLDDYFYPYPVTTTDSTGKTIKVDFPDSAEFAQYGSQFTSKEEWRRDNVNKFVQQLSVRIKVEKSSVKFGISPFGIWKNSTAEGGAGTNGMSSYYDLYADSKNWIDNQWIDYIIPQIYWNFGYSAADYKLLTDWWAQKVSGKNVSLYIGHAAYKIGDGSYGAAWTNSSEVPNQILYNRQNPLIKGSAFFSTRDILANRLGIYDQLKNNLYSETAIVPVMSWKDNIKPASPLLITAKPIENYIELKWNKSLSTDVSKYIIYRFNIGEGIDLSNPNKIIAVTKATAEAVNTYKDNSIKLDEKYVYAVTAVDTFSNESNETIIDMSAAKILSFTADKLSPQKINTTINLEAEAVSSETPLYRVSINDGGGWKILQEYSTKTEFQWNPEAKGNYNIKLEVKNTTSQKDYDDAMEIPYTINGIYKVALDPGHGGTDPGATGYSGALEKDLTLSISMKVRYILESRGIEVFMTRDIDKYLSLAERSTAANNWKADILVSIHQNAFIDYIKDSSGNIIGVRYPQGIETFSYPNSVKGAALSSKIQTNLINNTGAVNRGTKTANFHMLRETSMPSALVECGFITNPDEEAKMKTNSYQDTVAYSIAYGILEYFDMNREDVDRNGTVDLQDLAKIASNYNVRRGDANWIEGMDINNDNLVDLYDITLASKRIK